MNDLAREMESWPDRIDKAMVHCGAHLRDYIIISQIASTQDIARKLNVPAGTVIIAGAQTAGRGRFGRSWSGDPSQGVYVSIVLPWKNAPRLAIASAVGVVSALQMINQGNATFGIKWPNDVLAQEKGNNTSWRKLSGVLVEQFNDCAIIGIGINVLHRTWPEELAERAVSLLQLGIQVERIAVIEQLLPAIDAAITLNCVQLTRRFNTVDIMTGRVCNFVSAGENYKGEIMSIDPQRGLHVRLDGDKESRWFAAESTTLQVPSAK